MKKINKIPTSLKNIDLKSVLRRRGIYIKQNSYMELKRAAMPLARRLVEKRSNGKTSPTIRRHAQFTNEVVNQYWEKQIHIVEIIENKFEAKIEQYIKKVEKGFLEQLDTEVSNRKEFIQFINKDYFSDNEDDLLAQAQLDFTPLLENIAILAGQEANKLIGINDPYIPFNYREQIKQNVAKFAQSMLETDRDALINLVTNGLTDGKSIPEIRSAIQETFSTYSKTQSQRITRTEVIRASNQASLDAYQQSGVVEGKQWLTAGAVDECAQYEGQIVTLSDSFYGSDSEFQDGDPPIHPNCRCVILPVLVNEKAYAPPVNKELYERIQYLESQIDKRTKAWKKLKEKKIDDDAYIKALEKYLGNEPISED